MVLSPRRWPVLLLGAALAAGGCAPRAACPPCSTAGSNVRAQVRRSGRAGLINPLLDVLPEAEFAELRPFERKVESEIDRLTREGKAESVAVFWQDLDNGQLFSLRGNEAFAPASLLKVPIMIAALKQSQAAPDLLARKVPYRLPPPGFKPEIQAPGAPLVPGRLYSIDELLQAMAARSDNGAAATVYETIGDGPVRDLFRDLGIAIPDVRGPDDTMSVREYSAFFRILYNGSYIDRDRSERALEYLAQSDFKAGLVAGVPAEVIVSHKFGERDVEGKRQLHDCGIVYEPEEPYVLCVMTRGKSFTDLAETISAVSSLVYREVHAQVSR